MKIGVVGNQRYPELGAVLARLARYVGANGHTLVSEPDLAVFWPSSVETLESDEAALDLLVTFGGDGTFLRGVKLLGTREVPVLAINLGEIGFLTSAKPEALEAGIAAVASGDYVSERRFRMEAERLAVDGTRESCATVVNDVVVHKPESAKIIRVRLSVDGEEVGQYTADGMIVSTPAGSTAYSMSAGGPVMLPDVDAMAVTPICPHTLRVRPIVVSGASVVELESIPRGVEEPLVSLDGQVACSLKRGDRLFVRRAPLAVYMVRPEPEGFFARMRRKLEWGDLSDRERMTRAD